MTQKKVYVSSTFIDLQEFRAKVLERLRRSNSVVVAMEDYPAFDERPADKCLADVERCDIYVGILAKRYGHIPVDENPDGLSITEMEYRKAGDAKPRLMFQLDPEAPWLDRYNDKITGDGDHGVKIRRFRDHVSARHGIRHFKEPEELAGLVLEAILAELQKRDEQDGHPDRDTTIRWPTEWDFTAYIDSKREDFVGREWLFSEIENWLQHEPQRLLLVRADFGVGKSAIIAELLRRNPSGVVAGWHFCQHDTQETLLPATIVRNLALQFRDTIPGYREAVERSQSAQQWLDVVTESPVNAFEAAILNVLAQLPSPSISRMLLLDALDEGLELDTEAVRKWGTIVSLLAAAAARFPKWLRVLATSRNNPSVVGPLQQAFALKQIDAEDSRNLDDLRRYVRARCASTALAAKMAVEEWSAESIVDVLSRKSGGKFLYAVRALNDVADGRLGVSEIEHLPPGMDGFYLSAFTRRFGADPARYESVRDALGVLAAAREPLSPAVLAGVLGRPEAEIKLTLAIIPDFLRVLQGRYSFDHFSLVEWLTLENDQLVPRAARYAVDLSISSAQIRAWALEQVHNGSAHEQPYLVRHLAAHLGEVERTAIYGELMYDPRWLQAVVVHAGLDALTANCAHLAKRKAAQTLGIALRNSLQAIKRDCRQLPSQLLGRLGEPDGAVEIASLCKALRAGPVDAPALIPETASLGLQSNLLTVLRGNGGIVTTLVGLSDGRLASGSADGIVRVWDAVGLAEPAVLSGHQDWVKTVVGMLDGRLASGSDDHTVRVWDASGGESLVLRGHQGWVTTLAVLSDGRIASGSEDQTVRVWDRSGRDEPLVLRGHEQGVTTLAVLRRGHLASGSADGTVRVWDVSNVLSRDHPLVLRGHERGVTTLTVLLEEHLASGSADGTVRVWTGPDWRASVVLRGHEGGVTTLVAVSDGRLISGSDDDTIRIWDGLGRGEQLVLRGHESEVTTLAVLRDGRFASGSDDGTVRLWDKDGKSEPIVLRGHEGPVTSLAVLHEGCLASGSTDGTIRIWNDAGAGEPRLMRRHERKVRTLALLPDGRLASGSDDGTVRVWDGSGRGEPLVWRGHEDRVTTLAVLLDGRLASGSDDETIRVWSRDGEGQPLVLRGHEDRVTAIVALPDGGLASGSEDGTVRVWDARHRREPLVLRGHKVSVWALAVLRDGRLASGADDVRVWDLARGSEGAILRGHPGPVTMLAVLTDGRLITGGIHVVSVMDVESPGDPLVLYLPGAVVTTLTVLRDGRVACGDDDGTVHVWGVLGGGKRVLLGRHDDALTTLSVLPDGSLVSGSIDRTVRVWDVRAVEMRAMFVADGSISALVILPNGLIAAGDGTGAVHFLRPVGCGGMPPQR